MPGERPSNEVAASTVARYFRRYRFFGSALKEYGTRGADGGKVTLRTDRDQAVKQIRKALGTYPYNYAAGRQVIRKWTTTSSTRSARRVSRDLHDIFLPLLAAFENPSRFLSVTAPSLYPDDFSPDTLDTSLGEESHLDIPFDRWGLLLLANKDVRAAFRRAEPILQNLCIDTAENRTIPRHRGRRPELTDAMFWRLYEECGGDFPTMAAKTGMTVQALDKRLQRLKKKSRV